jgi:hypothetical protein
MSDLPASPQPAPELAELTATLPVQAAPTDPLWVSALRGRVLAAIASVISVGTAGTMLYRAIQALAAGPTLEGAAAVATHAAAVTDALSAALIAGMGLVAMYAALYSKAREWVRTTLGL